ncbi:MAG: hypothetical protein LBG80_11700 [Bacteroidales bacterium]|jgi:hypothetical protein|nr:hypothetical protein [Bacteroidales bacterium]
MIKNKWFLFLLICCNVFFTTVFAQKSSRKIDTTKGFDFFFNAGMYLGHKANANYYAGDPSRDPDPAERKYGDPNIWYVLNNPYRYNEIIYLIDERHSDIILDTAYFRLDDISGMRYNLAFSFGVGARYRFSESFALSFLFSQVRLTAEGVPTFEIKGTGTNTDVGEIKYLGMEDNYKMVGKERRNFFGVNASYLFETTIPYVFPFLELGVHLNSTKVISSEVIIEERSFSIINRYGEGTVYDPGISSTEIDPHLGGIGYGFIGGLGVRLAFNTWAAIEPVVQISAEKIHLSSYNQIRPNYNFMIRLVMGDKVFAKKQ